MTRTTTLLFLFACLFCSLAFSQGVGINASGVSPNASAGLDVDFSDKGFLPPRLSTTQRNAITNPAPGLTIYNTTVNCLQWWNGTLWYDGCQTQAQNLASLYPTGFVFCAAGPTPVVQVTNPITGKVWMDRNLGASQVATSPTDFQGYGSLYQWGRPTDGHQCINWSSASVGSPVNGTTASTANTDIPSTALFITNSMDWRNPRNDNLWQGGVSAINNPCPTGFRIPTYQEWVDEYATWGQLPANGFHSNYLKLTLGGQRGTNGAISGAGTSASYWASDANGAYGVQMGPLTINSATMNLGARSAGMLIRCIKN